MDSNLPTRSNLGTDEPLLAAQTAVFSDSAAGAAGIGGPGSQSPGVAPDVAPYTTDEPEEANGDNKKVIVIAILAVVVILACVGGSVYFLLQPTTDTARVRDVFIIFMALESLLTGVALVVLIVQLARLINLLQNEVKPILDSTNETVSHLRGTTIFLSENLVEPVIKLNEYMAGFTQLVQLLGLVRKPKRK
jgi:hypothetical protein